MGWPAGQPMRPSPQPSWGLFHAGAERENRQEFPNLTTPFLPDEGKYTDATIHPPLLSLTNMANPPRRPALKKLAVSPKDLIPVATLPRPLTLEQARARTETHPADPRGWKELACCLLDLRKLDEAKIAADRATELAPQDPEAWTVRGQVEVLNERDSEATKHLKHALELNAKATGAHRLMAGIMMRMNRFVDALRHINEALEQMPENLPMLSLKAAILTRTESLDEAEGIYKKLIQKAPSQAALHWSGLANIYREQGLLERSEAAYLKSLDLNPSDHITRSNWLTLLHYMPGKSADEIKAACQTWGKIFPKPTNIQRPRPADAAARRKLRVGMFSDGFRQHPVGAMTTPALKHLEKFGIELYLYTTTSVNDAITAQLKAVASQWMPVNLLGPEQFAQRIREDEIDILVDLSGHGNGTKMRTMVLEPAPLLVKWVGGLINTTGVESIDYLITDSIESPPGSDVMYTEKLIRMPDDYICYMPPVRVPNVGPLPAQRNGYITFGCFNNPTKINDVLLAEWAKLMHAVPNSRLFLKGGSYKSKILSKQVQDVMEQHGISPDRVRLEGQSPHYDLLNCYNDVDIALDPWPYSGGLTTCEAMLMGVPVVTHPGPTFAGRHSATHLANAGMPELVVDSWDEYRARVLELVGDLDSLATIRQHLRQVLLESTVCDGIKYARHMADAFRAIWQRYCEGKAPAALAFTEDWKPWFEDEDQPMTLVQPDLIPKASDDGAFSFSFSGKIVTLDHGGALIGTRLLNTPVKFGVLTTVVIDPASSLKQAEAYKLSNRVQHYQSHIALGNGEPGILYTCLGSEYSGTLEPLPPGKQLPFNRQPANLLAKLPIATTRLDQIDGLDKLDWLILNEANDNKAILQGAEGLLPGILVVHVRVLLIDVFRKQPDLATISKLLGKHGFRLLRIENQRMGSMFSAPKLQEQYSSIRSQISSVDAIFVPTEQRLKQLDDNQRGKLAFLLHTVYRAQDSAHHVLEYTGTEISQRYLDTHLSAPGAPAKGTEKSTTRVPVTTANPPRNDQAAPFVFSGEIPSVPHMETEGRELLATQLAQAKIFLEYGSGGSSVMAASTGVKRIYSVDSDRGFLDAVAAKIKATTDAPDGKYIPIYVDIGPTKEWGMPIDRSKAAQWPDYFNAPWARLAEDKEGPDLILIDGRFRVACFLASLLHAQEGCVILFDDYMDRPHYHAVEEFLKRSGNAGRMGRFVVPKNKPKGLKEAIEKFAGNPG